MTMECSPVGRADRRGPRRLAGTVAFAAMAACGAGAAQAQIISDFRLRGPSGPNDEFVRIYNQTAAPVTVASTTGAGWALAASSGGTRCIIPNGTVIPAGGSFLCANGSPAYGLGGNSSGTPDATYATDIPDNAGVALFNTTDTTLFNLANRLDAVGSTGEANTLYKEGGGYPAIREFSIDYGFSRDRCGKGGSITTNGACPAPGIPRDTGNNATDFIFVDTNGTSANAGQRLGAPGPSNLAGPVAAGSTFATALLDECVARGTAPNAARDFRGDSNSNATFGTLDLRRRFTNTTGAAITRLRFRVIDLTTFPAPQGFADVRPMTSGDIVVTVDRSPCGSGSSNVTVRGATLEEPPRQPNGGGFNSTLSVPSVSAADPLAPGASIDVRFLLGIQQTGLVRFAVVAEGTPTGGGVFEFRCNDSGVCEPSVTSITRAGPASTAAATVSITVTFDQSVTGVDVADFVLVTTGGVTGASVASVTPVADSGGRVFTVVVNTGTGDGTLRLDLSDNDSIVNGADQPLGGQGAGNGNFTGEAYTIARPVIVPTMGEWAMMLFGGLLAGFAALRVRRRRFTA